MKMDFDELKKIKMNFTAFFSGISSKISPKKSVVSWVTACDLGRERTVLLEMEKRPDHVFLRKLDILKNTFRDQSPALVLKPFLDGKKFSKDGIRAALKGHGVVVRFIRFPKMKVEELRSAMKYEVEQYIPFELKDVALDFDVVEESLRTDDGEKMEVILAVVKRSELDSMLEIFRNLECRLSLVDINILSAMTALEYFHPEDFAGHAGLLDLGSEISTLGIVRDGKPRFIRDLSYGTLDLHKRLKTRSNMTEERIEKIFESYEDPTPEESRAIAESLEGLIGDLRVSLDYYHDQAGISKTLAKLFVIGNMAHPVVLKALGDGLHIPVSNIDILAKIQCAPEVDPALLKMNASLLPVALGLGLREE